MVLYFNTLKYSERLKEGGVDHSTVLAEALDEALKENIFNKNEIEKMFAEALQRFDKRTEEMDRNMQEIATQMAFRTSELSKEMAVQRSELSKEMAVQRSELITEIHKTSRVTIGVISGLFAIMASLATVGHFIH